MKLNSIKDLFVLEVALVNVIGLCFSFFALTLIREHIQSMMVNLPVLSQISWEFFHFIKEYPLIVVFNTTLWWGAFIYFKWSDKVKHGIVILHLCLMLFGTYFLTFKLL